MALQKVTYISEETVISAENLNDIQDAIIKVEDTVDKGVVPTARTINGKPLSTDISLSANDVGAAPSGYGIGSSAKSIGDANNATVGGIYYYGSTASNIPNGFGNGVIFVQNRADAQIFQRISDIYGLVAERIRQSNGTWGEWKQCGPSAFAPAGYGLGEQVFHTHRLSSMTDLDNLNRTCYFALSLSSSATIHGVEFGVAYGRHLTYADGIHYQELIMIGVLYKFERYCYNGKWSEWHKTDPEAFAPSGYGLGTVGADVSDANHVFDVFRNGWFRTFSTTANTAVAHGAGIALVYDANRALHLLAKTTAGTMRTRYTPNSDGVFVEDLINPPMTAGYEYRTIERWSGKTVYVKVVDFGALPNNTYKAVAHGSSLTTCLRYNLVNKYSSLMLEGHRNILVNVDATNVQITTNADLSTHQAWCVIWYTKD